MRHTTMTDASGAIEVASLLIARVGVAGFSGALMDVMTTLIPNTVPVILATEAKGAPVLLASRTSAQERISFNNAYMGGAYLLGPGYRTSQDTDFSGVCLLRDIFPGDIRSSRYFHMYWDATGTSDEMFQFIRLDNDRTIYISLGRPENAPKFRTSDIKALSIVEPIIRESIRSHWNNRAFESGDTQALMPNHDKFRNVLDTFGTDVLSRREAEVCQLLLRGHSSKSAARKLEISPETERIHRRRVYSKLYASSQVEVMAKFMATLVKA
ncbi:MAG: helix-turn-helix transcriptional regulator [Rhodospirillales bacterium]|jgi:DNA-binding CsgD family transcriptional regulator|nr:helix-turn-helix transcriptional regulator [Rhodospirillales bacterium]MBT4041500.1 helix-turn-helix transcriptional regulator [Rhodospirillales bacterium]MBT4627505.1 helix-turn-helix transcriptional regulator [Rhodospirillales bacterium]MBT5351005.1 helix-turn-helix transcriptional regulator [Rhodospirillales bacterium]MBT5520940.1 helix-turn-helix transcriptional regulator [Rhodospirillales bacterium]